MRAFTLIVASALICGCLNGNPRITPEAGVELVEYYRHDSHFHDGVRIQEHHLEPPDQDATKPDSCMAYRSEVLFATDTCLVSDEPDDAANGARDWHLVVTSHIRDNEPQDFKAQARAFLESETVASWDGARADEDVMAPE